MKKYAKDVVKCLISADPTPQVVLQGKRFSLPIGEKNITLDFGNIPESARGNKKALTTALNANFDSVYRDDFTEKAFDSMKNAYQYTKDHPAEVAVDVGSIVISGLLTVAIIGESVGTPVMAS